MKYYIKFTDINDYGLNKIYNLKTKEHFQLCGGDDDSDSDSPIDLLNDSPIKADVNTASATPAPYCLVTSPT